MENKHQGLIHRLGLKRRPTRSPALGTRELAVMEALWQSDHLSAQQVLNAMADRTISLSTIQSTLERLYRKKLVARTKKARAYLYSPLLTRQDVIRDLLRDITEEIAGGEISPVISGFMAYLADERGDAATAFTELSKLQGESEENE